MTEEQLPAGKTLARERHSAGLSQSGLAALLGISPGRVGAIETLAHVQPRTVARVRAACGSEQASAALELYELADSLALT